MNFDAGAWKSRLLALLLLLLTAGCGPERPLAQGMNVLLITLDTTRVDYVSPFGGEPRITPNLQALADRSTIFTRALSETNITSPSHMTIMSGLQMIEHGVMSNLAVVPNGVDTLPEAMRRAGYRTAGVPAASHVALKMGWRGFEVLEDVSTVLTANEVSDRALRWLEEPDERPFFLWAHYFDPHTLYEPPADIAELFYDSDPEGGDGPKIAEHPYFTRKKYPGRIVGWLGEIRDPAYPRSMYAAEIHYADRELGRLLDAVERLGLKEQTVVVVVADHGESLGEHDIFYSHQGIYEPQLRIPLIVHVPGLDASSSDELVTTVDLAATISELTGVQLRHESSGLSLVPLLLGSGDSSFDSRRAFVHQQGRNRAVALRQDGWKLIWPLFKRHRVLPSQPQLFNLRQDPDERVNLANEHPERVETMRRALRPWIELGVVNRGDEPRVDAEAVEHLRSLGYLGD